jgi:hypothetical protein
MLQRPPTGWQQQARARAASAATVRQGETHNSLQMTSVAMLALLRRLLQALRQLKRPSVSGKHAALLPWRVCSFRGPYRAAGWARFAWHRVGPVDRRLPVRTRSHPGRVVGLSAVHSCGPACLPVPERGGNCHPVFPYRNSRHPVWHAAVLHLAGGGPVGRLCTARGSRVVCATKLRRRSFGPKDRGAWKEGVPGPEEGAWLSMGGSPGMGCHGNMSPAGHR